MLDGEQGAGGGQGWIAVGEVGRAPLAGLAIGFAQGRFRIEVVGPDGRPALSLGPYCETEVVAAWRRLAASSGLPLLVGGADGRLSEAYRQIGRVVLGPHRDPKRLAVLAGRRPRFLTRRKPARMPPSPEVVGGRELAAGSAG